jgi:hypothetical protein
MRRGLSAPRTALLQPESLAAKSDSFEQGDIWRVTRFGKCIKEGVSDLKQFLAMLRLHSDKNVSVII